MSETSTDVVHTVELPRPPMTKWDREYQAFLRLLPDLLKSHRGQYVAVHNEQVVDVGDHKIDLAYRVYEKYGYLPIYVGIVAERPLPLERMPSVHMVQT
jgi:hypothetical protein